VKFTGVTLTATVQGHSLESQGLYGDHGDTHKSCLNILFVMITIQKR